MPVSCFIAILELNALTFVVILATVVYTIVKLALTTISITMPIPYGIYIPLFAIGAAFGRACGELFALIFPEQGVSC